MMSYWKRVDEGLIKRGMLIMDLDFVRGYRDELIRMNRRKRGRPYRIAESYVRFLAVIRYLFSLGYRQLEGLTRSLGRIFPTLPVIDYSWIRRRIVLLGEDLVSYNMRSVDGPVVIVLDSTGVKVCRSGSWLERRYSRRRGYLKMHFAIDARTGEIVCFERTTDRVHDSEVAKRMVDRSMGAGKVIKVIGDGAYDSIRLIRHLERRGIEPIIRPRRDARTDRGPPSRRSAARMIRDYGYRAWSRIVGHGGRWMAETAISRFKALFGEHLLSRKPRWMDSELTIKALIYNMLLSAVTT
jgi:hypothetical protein